MGLKNHTAICILREQRRRAEAQSHFTPKSARPKTVDRVKFSLLNAGDLVLSQAFKPFMNRKEQDESLRLLQRLRQALKSSQQLEKPAGNKINDEYLALQDELQRLTSHAAQVRDLTVTPESLDLDIPASFAGEKTTDQLPYFFIHIGSQDRGDFAKLPIVRLETSLTDLRSYTFESRLNTGKVHRNLTLVKEIPDGPALLIGETCELGQVIADLTQQTLHEVRSQTTTVPIPQDIALSLLNS